MEDKITQKRCVDCDYYHQNDPDYPENCEYPDCPPCLDELIAIMTKKPSTKVLKTCRIEKQYIDYCRMQVLNFNGLVNELLKEFLKAHQRSALFRLHWQNKGIEINYKETEL